MTGATRTLVVWFPDWPVVAAGVPLDVPAAVFHGNRVVASSPAARAEGVERHLRRRDAQARCPELVVLPHDPAGEARAFEAVPAALEALTPRIEITHPGACAFPTRGPSRYHGGDLALAELAAAVASEALAGRVPVRVGVADGPFAAALAARRRPPVGDAPAGRGTGVVRSPRSSVPDAGPSASGSAGRNPSPPGEGSAPPAVVPPGGSPDFLAPVPVTVLAEPGGPVGPELVDVFERLGIRTLGALAGLPVAEVVGRFGTEGLAAHRLARGLDERPPVTAPPPEEWALSAEIDPPADRVEAAAFVARRLVDDLHARLDARGSACTRLVIGAETEHGETHERVWRTEGTFTALAIADRVRWQLDGWLSSHADRPTAGLTRVWLAPDEIVPAGGRQLTFGTGTPGAVDAVEAGGRAARAVARVQGLLGADAVRVPEWRGGRGPAERVDVVAVAADDVTEARPAAGEGWVAEPWPGAVPAPAPATVHDPPLRAEVVDAAGHAVLVSGRGELSAPPAQVRVDRPGARSPVDVAAWAGPWPCDERWWDPQGHRRRARLQVITATGAAYLFAIEGSRWSAEATYD
jgi:protein ImuB